MKKIKRYLAIILSMVLGFSMSTVSFASERYNQNDNSKGTCSKEDVDLSNGGYTIIYEDWIFLCDEIALPEIWESDVRKWRSPV